MTTSITVEIPTRDGTTLRNTRSMDHVKSVVVEQGALYISRMSDDCHIEDIFAPGQWYSVTSYQETK